MPDGPEPLSLAICVVHHPGSDLASQLRSRIYKHYRRDPQKNLGEGGLGLEVEYRSEPMPSRLAPIPIDFGRAAATAVVVILDRELASDAAFANYIADIAALARPLFPRATVLAVAVDEEGYRLAHAGETRQWQTLDARAWPQDTFTRRLFTEVDRHLCRLLAAYIEGREHPLASEAQLRRAFARKAQVFLSHSKHDQDRRGVTIALGLKTALAETGADAFFDAIDIPPGTPWEEMLDDAASSHALVAIVTDSYSSRTWCRKEVLAAKRAGVPIVVASCLEDIEERGFPYAGNVPIVQMLPDPAARTPQLVGRLFDEVLRNLVWRCNTIGLTPLDVLFHPRAPELVSLAYLERDTAEEGRPSPLTVVYPGVPLGAEEEELFQAIAPHLRLTSFVGWKAGLAA